MSTRYYRTTDANAIAALEKFHDDTVGLQRAWDKYADAFGAEALLYFTAQGSRFAGFKFRESNTDPIWTKPDKDGIQRLRTAVPAPLKEQHAAMRDKMKWLRPEVDSIDREPFNKSIGTSWGTIMFSGLQVFRLYGELYIATKSPLTDHCIEIVGSEFDVALAALNENKSEAVHG